MIHILTTIILGLIIYFAQDYTSLTKLCLKRKNLKKLQMLSLGLITGKPGKGFTFKQNKIEAFLCCIKLVS